MAKSLIANISSPVSDRRMPFKTKDMRMNMTDLAFKWTAWNRIFTFYLGFNDSSPTTTKS